MMKSKIPHSAGKQSQLFNGKIVPLRPHLLPLTVSNCLVGSDFGPPKTRGGLVLDGPVEISLLHLTAKSVRGQISTHVTGSD
jgi:hypothetical protein